MNTEKEDKLQDAVYDYIEFVICYGEGFKPEEIKIENRKAEIVFARQLIMYFCVLFKAGTLAWIGEQVAGKDHATVLHSVKTINNFIDTDKSKRIKIEYYKSLLEKVLALSKKTSNLKAALKPLEDEISALEQRCINLTLQIAFIKKEASVLSDA